MPTMAGGARVKNVAKEENPIPALFATLSKPGANKTSMTSEARLRYLRDQPSQTAEFDYIIGTGEFAGSR